PVDWRRLNYGTNPASSPRQDHRNSEGQELILGQDPQQELKDLITVHNFYLGLLTSSLGHGVPVPAEINNVTATPENTATLIQNFKLWLDVLDLALTPPLVRDALKTIPGFETTHALLRYFTTKASQRAGDRDKTDCIITFLFRTPEQEGAAWHRPEVDSSYAFISQASLAFEGTLYRALGDVQCESMPPEHVTLLQEFEYLFPDAAIPIKTYAETVQRDSRSILSRVEGDITVQNLSEVEPTELMAE